jgi:predicted DNA-binding transcriptional regulator YafY
MLGDDEALAVLLGLLAGRRSGLTAALGPAGETAAAKIRRVLPGRLADRLQGVLDSVAFTASPDQSAAPDATVLLTIADAVAEHRPIAVTYTGRDGARTDRTLHPHGIVSHGERWYVRALDPAIGEERTFRLDRIGSARTLPGSFEPPAAGGGRGSGDSNSDLAQDLLAGFATADYRYEVSIRVQGTVEQIRTRFPASVATIQPIGEENGGRGRDGDSGDQQETEPSEEEGGEPAPWHRLTIRAERLDWLPPTLAALDLPFVIERPAELRDLVLALAERLASRARRGPA